MGKLTAVDINPFFGRITIVRLRSAGADDKIAESIKRSIVPLLTADIETYPIDILVVARHSHIADMEDGEGKEEAQAQERIDIAAAIQNLLRKADKGGGGIKGDDSDDSEPR